MVDMVEARKRAKLKIRRGSNLQEQDSREAEPPKAKPVLRSQPVAREEEPSAYFPVAPPAQQRPEGTPDISPVVPFVPESIPTTTLREDQVDFLQRLFQDEADEEESAEKSDLVAEEEIETLIFQLGHENYGMDIHQIAEIIRFQEPTEVPNTIAFLDGIISLRGRMIPVINGRKRLGHPSKTPDKKTRIIVLQDNVEYHGILVDSASQVVRLPKKSIEPTPSVVVGVDAEFIQGVCEYKNQLIILLNLGRFLQFQ